MLKQYLFISDRSNFFAELDSHQVLIGSLILPNNGIGQIWINKFSKIQIDENLIHWWWECKMVQKLWKTVLQGLKKLNIELPYDPAILLLGIYPKALKIGTKTNTCIHIS